VSPTEPGRLPPLFRIPSEQPSGGVREVAVGVTNLWRSPDVVADLDAPMQQRSPDVAAWTASLSRDQRQALVGRLDTQLLLGEPVLVVDESGPFSEVRALWQPSGAAPEGYPGWVRTDHLATPSARGPRSVTVGITERGVTATTEAGGQRIALSYGTALWLADGGRPSGDGLVTVALPGGRRASVPAGAVRRHGVTYDPDALVESARTFLGLGYLWGGLSSWGTDCSGLVHLTHRLHGWVIPRDADDQHRVCDPVDDAQPGDLYFFRRDGSSVHHVGYVADGGRLLHAPGTGDGVEDVQMSADRAATSLGTWRPALSPGE
jgi:cell wall-associated NlpC family hydrolase